MSCFVRASSSFARKAKQKNLCVYKYASNNIMTHFQSWLCRRHNLVSTIASFAGRITVRKMRLRELIMIKTSGHSLIHSKLSITKYGKLQWIYIYLPFCGMTPVYLDPRVKKWVGGSPRLLTKELRSGRRTAWVSHGHSNCRRAMVRSLTRVSFF